MKTKTKKQKYYLLRFDTRNEDVEIKSFEVDNEEEAINIFEEETDNCFRTQLLSETQFKNLVREVKWRVKNE